MDANGDAACSLLVKNSTHAGFVNENQPDIRVPYLTLVAGIECLSNLLSSIIQYGWNVPIDGCSDQWILMKSISSRLFTNSVSFLLPINRTVRWR